MKRKLEERAVSFVEGEVKALSTSGDQISGLRLDNGDIVKVSKRLVRLVCIYEYKSYLLSFKIN